MTGIAIWTSCYLPMLLGGLAAGLGLGWLLRGRRERRLWLKRKNKVWR